MATRLPRTELTRFQRDIIEKISSLEAQTRQPTIDYQTLASELARALAGNQPEQSHDTSTWVVPQAARPEHKRLFHSVRRSKMFKVSLNKSLAILEKRRLIRVHVPPREMRRYPGEKHLSTTAEGRKAAR